MLVLGTFLEKSWNFIQNFPVDVLSNIFNNCGIIKMWPYRNFSPENFSLSVHCWFVQSMNNLQNVLMSYVQYSA